jgi:hypothetical protein
MSPGLAPLDLFEYVGIGHIAPASAPSYGRAGTSQVYVCEERSFLSPRHPIDGILITVLADVAKSFSMDGSEDFEEASWVSRPGTIALLLISGLETQGDPTRLLSAEDLLYGFKMDFCLLTNAFSRQARP